MKPAKIILFGLLIAFASTPAQAEKIAITNATLYPMTGDGSETIPGATLLMEEGKIIDLGADIEVPQGFRQIDAGGRPVTPGFFNGLGALGISEVTLSAGIVDSRAKTSRLTIAPDVAWAFNPDNSFIPSTRIAGVTRAAIAMEASQSIFGGQGAVTHFAPGIRHVSHPRAFVYADLGERGGRLAGGSRAAAWAEFESALREADNLVAHPRNHWAGGKEEPLYAHADLEALLPAAKGAVPLVVRVDRASDIRNVIALKQERRAMRLVIYGGAEAWRVANELSDANIPVILNPFKNLPEDFSHIDSRLENAALLHQAGVKIAMTTEGNSAARLLTQYAGNAVANGLPHGAALLALTRNPAEIYGIDDRVGTLAPGRDADIVIWSGDPFEVMHAPTHVFIQGEDVPLISRQIRLRERYRNLQD